MPRGGPPTYTYTLPPVYLAVPGTTILATQHNTPLEDIEDTFNTEWPGYLVQWVVPTADVLELPDGAVGAPSLTFTNDTDSGLYRIGANNLGFALNGTKSLDIGLNATGHPDGAVALPGITFNSDPDTGMYRIGANNIGVAVNGAKVLDVSSTGLGVVGTVLSGNGAVGTPAFSFTSDPDTGIYRIGANDLGIAAGGVKYIEVADGTKTITITTPSGGILFALGDSGSSLGSPNGLATLYGAPVDLALGQLRFPGTQNPSSNANTLDDYREGVWTPVLTPASGSITSSTNSGTYVKIGQVVLITFDINITNAGTGAGQLTVGTLPFNAGISYSGAVRDGLSGALCSIISSGSTAFALRRYDNNTMIATGARVIGSFTYQATA